MAKSNVRSDDLSATSYTRQPSPAPAVIPSSYGHVHYERPAATSTPSLTQPNRVIQTPVPSIGFLRLTSIIGNPRANPPQPALIPVCRATWWKGCKAGRFPKPLKIGRATVWRAEDILDLIERIGNREAA